MKAIRIHNYGGPEVLKYEDAPRPEPQADEVLIRVHAAGVNRFDWEIRAGHLKDIFPVSFPLILGWDLSGVIEEVGSGATRFKKGDEVFSIPDPPCNVCRIHCRSRIGSRVEANVASSHPSGGHSARCIDCVACAVRHGEVAAGPTHPDPRRRRRSWSLCCAACEMERRARHRDRFGEKS